MIPVIIGAAVGLAGAALLSGDDKKQPETEKRQVSEDYIMQQLNRAGKNFSDIQQTNFSAVQQADENTIQHFKEQHDKKHNDDELEKAFSNIEKKIAQPNRNNKAIKKICSLLKIGLSNSVTLRLCGASRLVTRKLVSIKQPNGVIKKL